MLNKLVGSNGSILNSNFCLFILFVVDRRDHLIRICLVKTIDLKKTKKTHMFEHHCY